MKKILFFIFLSILTLLTFAYADAFHEYVENCNLDGVKKFVDAGVDINANDSSSAHIPGVDKTYYYQPLYYALGTRSCGKGISGDKKKYELIKYLLDNGADVNLKFGYDGETPLYFLAYDCGTYAIKCYDLFIGKGADLSVVNENMFNDAVSPLTYIFEGFYGQSKSELRESLQLKIPTIKYLLEKELDPNIIVINRHRREEKSMLDIAYELGDFNLINLLKKHGAKKRIDIEVETLIIE